MKLITRNNNHPSWPLRTWLAVRIGSEPFAERPSKDPYD